MRSVCAMRGTEKDKEVSGRIQYKLNPLTADCYPQKPYAITVLSMRSHDVITTL